MSRKGWVVVATVGALALGLGVAGFRSEARRSPVHATVAHTAASVTGDVASAASVASTPRFEPFTPAQVDQFLTRARQVEAMTDPLQRCLAYPDPPGSHWNAEAVKAYCRYRTMPALSFADARRLIENGHADTLDRQLAEALHKQLTEPDSRGLLDHIYLNAFADGSFDVRATLDAWKRDAPRSAFAYAASGMAYAAMASKARGDKYIQDTPDDAILSMERLAQQADADLRQAIALEPRLTPAYATMMDLGRMTLGRRYAVQAFVDSLKVAPANFDLYATANVMAAPKWGGSLAQLAALHREELARAAANPLLYLDATDAQLRTFDFFSCRCDSPAELAQVMQAMASISSYGALASAGDSADFAKQHGLAAVYYAEAIRFAHRPNDRLSRAFELIPLGFPGWAHDEIAAVAPRLPRKASVYRGLAYADLELQENTRAISELEQAVRLDDTDLWSWESLGRLYSSTQQWDQAWQAAEQLIRLQPDAPGGWQLRAMVQINQPRAGLADTVQTFATRFGQRPDQQATLNQLRATLAHLKH